MSTSRLVARPDLVSKIIGNRRGYTNYPYASPGEQVYSYPKETRPTELRDTSVVKHILIGTGLGLIAGSLWKVWHWNEKATRVEFYRQYKKKQARDEKSGKVDEVNAARLKAYMEKLEADE